MGATPFSSENEAFTAEVHGVVVETLYHRIFGVPPDRIRVENTLLKDSARGAVLDGELAIDCTVHIKAKDDDFHAPLTFTVQERYRRPSYARFQDITITEWNTRSNSPSELYKITADYFVYGSYSRPLPIEGFQELLPILRKNVDAETLRRECRWIRTKADLANLLDWGKQQNYWRENSAGTIVGGPRASELRRMEAGEKGDLLDLVVVATATLKRQICNGELSYGWNDNPRTGQPFITCRFRSLEQAQAIMFWLNKDDNHQKAA